MRRRPAARHRGLGDAGALEARAAVPCHRVLRAVKKSLNFIAASIEQEEALAKCHTFYPNACRIGRRNRSHRTQASARTNRARVKAMLGLMVEALC